ncbi:MAG: hypothetical protein R3B82_04305 [Sandaracinaceae bacterium]
MYAGALFSVGRLGAEDVMEPLGRGRDPRGARRCWTMAGVSFATRRIRLGYATVLLAR